MVAGAAVICAISAAALFGMHWGNGSPAPPAAVLPAVDVRPPPGAGSDGVDEFAVPTVPAGWLALMNSLYDRRSAAFAAGDVERLTGVYTSSSAQAATDRAEIERLAAQGHRLDGFDPDVVSVHSARGGAPAVTLLVTDSFGPYTVVDDQRVLSSEAGRAAARVEVSLRLTSAGWRIESAVRLA